jgi:hypothetical protein
VLFPFVVVRNSVIVVVLTDVVAVVVVVDLVVRNLPIALRVSNDIAVQYCEVGSIWRTREVEGAETTLKRHEHSPPAHSCMQGMWWWRGWMCVGCVRGRRVSKPFVETP